MDLTRHPQFSYLDKILDIELLWETLQEESYVMNNDLKFFFNEDAITVPTMSIGTRKESIELQPKSKRRKIN